MTNMEELQPPPPPPKKNNHPPGSCETQKGEDPPATPRPRGQDDRPAVMSMPIAEPLGKKQRGTVSDKVVVAQSWEKVG